MATFIVEHFVEIIFGLISAGALAFCKHIYSKMKEYKKLVEQQEDDDLETKIETYIEPIKEEIEDLRKYIREAKTIEENHMNLIIASYRFRLVQLCCAYLKQGYMTTPEYEQLTEFYKVYHGLGGNGQAKTYYDKTIKLPIKDKTSQQQTPQK